MSGGVKKHSEETKAKISAKLKGRVFSEQTKQKMSANHSKYWAGKTFTDEHKKKLSEKGVTPGFSGKSHSQESRKKMSAAHTGEKHHFYGTHHTLETRDKISLSISKQLKDKPTKPMHGMFRPQNPSKYRGNVAKIVYRSGWEFQFMMKLDHDPSVVEWSSEETVIFYTSPLDRSHHRYFPDFFVKKDDGSCLIIEIKPAAQTMPPKKRLRGHNSRFLRETKKYAINMAKFEAAERYCQQRGYKFVVLTEKQMPSFI